MLRSKKKKKIKKLWIKKERNQIGDRSETFDQIKYNNLKILLGQKHRQNSSAYKKAFGSGRWYNKQLFITGS